MDNSFESISNKLKEVLINNGCLSILEGDEEELFFDSIEFVNLIVEIENEFCIFIPDDYLLPENFKTFKLICKTVFSILQNDSTNNTEHSYNI